MPADPDPDFAHALRTLKFGLLLARLVMVAMIIAFFATYHFVLLAGVASVAMSLLVVRAVLLAAPEEVRKAARAQKLI